MTARLRKLLSALLGGVFALVAIELLLSLAYKGFVVIQARQNHAEVMGGADEIRILCIGESTTAVAGDETGRMLVPHTSYPVHLERILNERQDAVHFRVINNGMMGGTTATILAMLQPSIDATDPHMIIAMMGIKDTADQQLPGLEWLPDAVRSLRTVQLFSWAREAIALRQQAYVLDVQSPDDLPEELKPSYGQLSKFIKETRMIGPDADLSATGDLQVATYLWFIDRHNQAADFLRRTIDRYGVGYNLLARVLVTGARADEAELLMADAIAADPAEGMYRVTLAEVLVDEGRLDDAQAVLLQADADKQQFRYPSLVSGYIQLGLAHVAMERGDYQGVVDILRLVRPSRRLDGLSADFFPRVSLMRALALGEAYLNLGDLHNAELYLTEALEIRPGAHATMWMLSKVYRQQGRRDDEESLRRDLLQHRQRMAEYFELAKLFRIHGDDARIPELFDEAVAQIPSIAASYRELYAVAERQGIDLAVMQYPSFSLELLHKYAPDKEGVIFIDNEHVFDENPDGYFFEPRFPNSFSHYTDEGAEVLASHIADTVLDVYAERIAQGSAAASSGRTTNR